MYYDKTQDSRALAMINYLKYGTNNSKEIMLLRYGFDFEELDWLAPCVKSIDENEIIFDDVLLEKLEQYQKDIICRYCN